MVIDGHKTNSSWEERKKVLIVSYHFPPDASVGAIRPLKYAKYLREFGWEPVVLTVKGKYYDQLDNDHPPLEYPHALVRTAKIPTLKDIYLSFKESYLKRWKSVTLVEEQQRWVPRSSNDHSRERILTKLHRYINSLFIFLPDNRVGWFFPALVAGFSLIKKHKIRAIFTTSPPHSVHLIGMALKLLAGIPWVADFRDPWDIQAKGFMARSKLSDLIEENMRQSVLKKSNIVICVTPEMTRDLIRSTPFYSKEKFITVANGFDFEEVKPFIGARRYPKFTITYAGTFYLKRDPFLLFAAVADLIKEKQLSKNDLQINLIGNCGYVNGVPVEETVKGLDLTGVVRITGYQPHEKVLSIMAASHVLFLLAADQPIMVPAKTYEYMGLGRFILAVCEAGATRNVLRNYPYAHIVDPSDISGMKKALLSFARRKDAEINTSLLDSMQKFHHRHLSGQLADIINKLTQSPNRKASDVTLNENENDNIEPETSFHSQRKDCFKPK